MHEQPPKGPLEIMERRIQVLQAILDELLLLEEDDALEAVQDLVDAYHGPGAISRPTPPPSLTLARPGAAQRMDARLGALSQVVDELRDLPDLEQRWALQELVDAFFGAGAMSRTSGWAGAPKAAIKTSAPKEPKKLERRTGEKRWDGVMVQTMDWGLGFERKARESGKGDLECGFGFHDVSAWAGCTVKTAKNRLLQMFTRGLLNRLSPGRYTVRPEAVPPPQKSKGAGKVPGAAPASAA